MKRRGKTAELRAQRGIRTWVHIPTPCYYKRLFLANHLTPEVPVTLNQGFFVLYLTAIIIGANLGFCR